MGRGDRRVEGRLTSEEVDGVGALALKFDVVDERHSHRVVSADVHSVDAE